MYSSIRIRIPYVEAKDERHGKWWGEGEDDSKGF
jgi:hypothetical protein